MDLITTAVSEGTKQTAKSLVDRFVNPVIDGLELAYKKKLIHINQHFQDYLLRNYEKYSTMNTLVFSNSQKQLKDIYIPLTITGIDASSNKQVSKKIDCYPKDIVLKYKKLLITDTAGMGKSTIMKYIYLSIIDSGAGIPIFIELRRLNASKDIFVEMQEQLKAINKDFNALLLREFISEGKLIFILDGYDEIPLADKNIVTEKMQDFITKASNNLFFMTSRPEESLSGFGEFVRFEINPLSQDEAYDLLRKYDKNGRTSESLIKKLTEEKSKSIEEFLKNPLLVSLLFSAFDFKQTIPLKKHLFYRQVFDAFFEAHDLSKGDSFARKKHTGLDIDEFHQVLRHIGYKSMKKIEFTKDEILCIIRSAKSFCIGLNFSESDLLKDILTTVPIFVKDGIYYKWAHKSLQEYFAAQFIFLDARDAQFNILEKIYKSEDLDKYSNLLELYYNIDYKGFRKVVTYALLCDFKMFSSNCNIDRNSDELNKKKCSILFNGFPSFGYVKEGALWTMRDKIKEFTTSNFDKHVKVNPNIQSIQRYILGHVCEELKLMYSLYDIKHGVILKILSNESFVWKQSPFNREQVHNAIIDLKIEEGRMYFIDFSNDYFLADDNLLQSVNIILENYSGICSDCFLDYDNSMNELLKIEEEKNKNDITLLDDI